MHDIVITVLNSKYVHSSLAPWCLYESIRENLPKVNALVYESTINADSEQNIMMLSSYKSKIYAFCCYIWNIKQTLFLAEKIKEMCPESIILLGGPEVSYRAENILNSEKYVDYIICGEGEEPICTFLKLYFENKDLSNVPGLCGKFFKNMPFISTKQYTSPYNDEYLRNLSGRISYIETSRGCPFNCAFCLSGRCGSVRYFSLERVFNDIVKLANSGSKTIKFVDRTFNANAQRANDILNFIINSSGNDFPKDVCFHFEIAGDILREDTLQILKNAPDGLFQLEIGLQTFNEKTLNAINRKTNITKLCENIKRLLSFENMHIHIDLIAGLPYEDYKSFKETFNKAYDLKSDMLQLGFLKLLHGSPMREESDKYPCVFSDEAPYEIISTPYISSDEIIKIKMVDDVLERLYNSNRFVKVLNYVTENICDTPFDLFYNFAVCIKKFEKGLSLDEYSKLFFEFLTTEYTLNKKVLRDLFATDRLSSNKSGKMPEFLKIEDSAYKKIKKHLAENKSETNFVLLYSENKIVFADYKSKRTKNGNFNLIYKDKDEYLKTI